MIKRTLFLFIILIVLNLSSFSQDELFTQFYNSPLTLNPGLAGCAKNDFRVCATDRMQWLNLAAPLHSYGLSADKYFADPMASLGFIASRYSEGYIKTTQLAVVLAKNFGSHEDDCRDWFFNFSSQIGIGIRDADRNSYLFADQIGTNGPNGQASQAELFAFSGKKYLDLSFGCVVAYRNIMFGAAAYHLNKPNNGLIGTTDVSRLPARLVFHCSLITDNDPTRDVFFKPTAIIQFQGPSTELLAGSLINFRNTSFEIGVWYKNNLNLKDSHSISIGINIDFGNKLGIYNSEPTNRFRAGLGYDAELSAPQVRYTGGSSEIGLLYEKNLTDAGTSICPKPYGVCDGVRYPWVFF